MIHYLEINLQADIRELSQRLHYLFKFITVSLVLIAYIVTCLLQARVIYAMYAQFSRSYIYCFSLENQQHAVQYVVCRVIVSESEELLRFN